MPVKRRRAPGVRERRRTGGEGSAETFSGSKTAPWSSLLTPSAVAIVIIALAAGVFHSAHLHSLFENDRFFSHLSPLERELSFRTEMGLYYSYYKTLVTAPTFSSGLASIVNDNTTEFPSTINTLRRFNLYPEVLLGGMYRVLRAVLHATGLSATQCFTIRRGLGQPNIQTCTGIGDPTYFYVEAIFSLNGCVASLLFLLGCYLSGSLAGGAIALSAFFFNHGEATRVMWTPPLRESFAFPFLLLETLAITHTLRHPSPGMTQSVAISLSALAFLLPWQFSQFALLTQVLSLLVVYSLRLIQAYTYLLILSAIAVALTTNILLQFANALLLSSFLPAALIACSAVVLLGPIFDRIPSLLRIVCEGGVAVAGVLGVKLLLSQLIGGQDDAHIGAILLSKLSSYQDFHTQLYTCAPEFDFLPPSYWFNISLTLLAPAAVLAACLLVWKLPIRGVVSLKVGGASRQTKDGVSGQSDALAAEQCYHVVQAVAYAIMAVLIMRLKLFLTPQLILLTSLLATPKVLWCVRGHKRLLCLSLLLAASSLKGGHNLWEQWSIEGEFNNPEQEQLVLWVNESTNENAVFAGAMPTTAAIKLSTGRAIVNHPHYEDAGLRERTKLVYSIFSRRPPSVIHATLVSLGASHVVVEQSWCVKEYRPGCSFPAVWDREEPEHLDKPVFCQTLQDHTPLPFKEVFKNRVYQVLLVQEPQGSKVT